MQHFYLLRYKKNFNFKPGGFNLHVIEETLQGGILA